MKGVTEWTSEFLTCSWRFLHDPRSIGVCKLLTMSGGWGADMAIDKPTLRKLRDVVGGSDADLMELIQSFLEEAPELLRSLTSARQSADLALVRRSAHSLKSNCRDFGALGASALLSEVETLTANGIMPQDAALTAAYIEVESALRELQAVLAEGTA